MDKNDNVETVELIKEALSANKSENELTEIINSALLKHSGALSRRLNGEPLIVIIARHCINRNLVDLMRTATQVVLRHRVLAQFTDDLKRFLIGNIVNEASVAGLFELSLSSLEAIKICRKAESHCIIPGAWSEKGLKYQQWVQYCLKQLRDNTNADNEFFQKVKNASQTAGISQFRQYHCRIDSGDAGEYITLFSIDGKSPLPDMNTEKWHRILKHENYAIRSKGTELVALYVANGKHQDGTLRMLLQSRKQVSTEVYLRAVSLSCIALAKKSSSGPARFPEESFTGRQEVVLSLTQHAAKKSNKQDHGEHTNNREDGVWSYLNCFQGQCLLFLSLLDALREEDPVSLFAAHQFKLISKELGRTPWQLLQPLWPWIAPKIVKRYNRKFVDWFCTAVLRVSMPDFLLRTSGMIVPHLCRAGKPQIKVCEEIAGFRGCSTRRLYIDNAAAIIAMFFMSSSEDVELAWSFAEERFMSLDKSFRTLKFNQVIASWRVDAIYEILMLTTEKNAALAIGLINKIMCCAYAQNNGGNRELLQQTVFKLVVKFSETMRNLIGRQSDLTKLSALTGLRILVESFLTPDLAASVLRQLTAFLQAALEDCLLSLSALQTWLAIVQKLDIAKMEAIVDLTYSIINDRVDTWDRDAVHCAEQIVQAIEARLQGSDKSFKIHPQSVFQVPEDEEDNADQRISEGYSSFDILQSLVERDIENTYIAQQTARDLCAFSLEYQDEILTWVKGDGPGRDLLGQTIRVLLNLCSRNDNDLKILSTRALGLLGALDPHTISIRPKDSTLVLVHNFQNSNEVVTFSRVLVQDWFLPAFEAAVDPAVQRYFAYGIQELLKFMGAEDQNKLKLLFKDDSLVSTLFPLIKTKYTTDMKHWTPPSYPIMAPDKSYADWLVCFCSDMMCRTSDPEFATKLFTWCRKVLYGSNAGPEMWAFLFPYASLAAVVDRHDAKVNREVFLSEVLLVLGTEGTYMRPYHEQVFALFDYFNQWMRSRRQAKLPLLNMDTLLAEIPARIMAQRALESRAYPRAIRYYEQQVREEPGSEKDVIHHLRRIYASMQDVDSLEGTSSRMPTLSVEQQVLEFRATSQWDSALACYSALPASDATLSATLECLHRSGREKDVLAEMTKDSLPSNLAAVGVECAWYVRDWMALRRWTSLVDLDQDSAGQIPVESTWALGNVLLSILEEDWDGFRNSLMVGRKHVGIKLGDLMATRHITSLRQVRELMVYLHGLADIESLGTMIMPGMTDIAMLTQTTTAKMVRAQLDARMGVLSPLSEGPEFEARRFLLSLRAAALTSIETRFPPAADLVAEAHLSISEAARHHDQPSIALMEIASAKYLKNDDADIEHARLLWSQGESRSAIRMLQSKIPADFFEKPKVYPQYAERALKWTTWRDNAAQADTKVLVDNYAAVIKALPSSAEAHYRLAKHYVKIFDQAAQSLRNDGQLSKAIVHHFLKALELGTSHASEALPKMITMWLDLGVAPTAISPQETSSRKHSLTQVNKEIQAWGKVIGKKLVYTAVPQLLSRLNHPNRSVRILMEQLIILVMQHYPNHTLWPVLEKGENTANILREAAAKIARNEQATYTSLIEHGSELAEKLKRLCAIKPKPKETKLAELGEDFSASLRVPSLAVPTQTTMDKLENVLIYEIEEKVVIQQSLQRPKRITIWGTDGKQYQLLLKGNDDVRKDARLIEFTTAVNQLLNSDAAAASRQLGIVTYRVTPLSANAGIIEWVNGAIPVRSIMYSLSRNPNLGLSSPEVKRMTNTSGRMGDRLKAFYSLQEAVPPVLWEWFVDTFPDPEAWLEARTRYARTLAVMSMIGYILGLGDRHLENILLLQSTGAVLHVDFDCLFDKGRHLAVPEIVPFRLTRQFEDALGVVNGYEGHFRKVSELTLKIVRANEDLLMVVLEAFIHDPVVQDRINLMQPRETMERLRAKIRGVKEPNTVPLSVGGLVDELIQVAVSPENLCQLFKGWMPWV